MFPATLPWSWVSGKHNSLIIHLSTLGMSRHPGRSCDGVKLQPFQKMASGWFVLLSCVLLNLSGVEPKKSHAVPTYFKRLHPDGSLVDASDPKTRLNFTSPVQKVFAPAAVLRASPDLVEDGGNVNVSWSGIPKPNKTDFIALYCPSNDDAKHYLDYFYVTESATYGSGYGSNEVNVFNLRSNCEFRYYHGKSVYTLVATSNLVKFKGGIDAPLQGHIALTGDPTEMRVMWVSGSAEAPVLWYGEDASLPLVAKGYWKTYIATTMCGPPASSDGFWNPGYIHDVLLKNLTPSTQYYYAYGSSKMRSSIRKFRTAPRTGPDVSFKFVAYGDMGLSGIPGAFDIAKFMPEEAANGSALIFHVGDISYARGYAYIWDQWHALIQPFATIMPYMVGMGNHEQDHTTGGSKDPSGAPGEGWHPWWGNYGDDSGGECGVPMFNRFHMPDNGNALWWYSFDYGSVHFVMISTEHNFTEGSRQYVWLESDLKRVDRTKTPWIVLGGHRPMYSSQKVMSDYLVSVAMQQSFENLLYKYNVDLAFWGHYHSYERTCPVYKHECQEEGLGTTHIVVGSAGAGLDKEDYWPMKWSRYHENDWGYGRILVANSTALYWEWVRNRDKVVRDKVWLIKPSKGKGSRIEV